MNFKSKSGLTLSEFVIVLAVVFLLGYFVIIPKAKQLIEKSRLSMFDTKVKDIITAASEEYLIKKNEFFSNVSPVGVKLQRIKDIEYEYYITLGSTGKIKSIKVTNGEYKTEYESIDGITSKMVKSSDHVKADYNRAFYLNSDGTFLVRIVDPEKEK